MVRRNRFGPYHPRPTVNRYDTTGENSVATSLSVLCVVYAKEQEPTKELSAVCLSMRLLFPVSYDFSITLMDHEVKAPRLL